MRQCQKYEKLYKTNTPVEINDKLSRARLWVLMARATSAKAVMIFFMKSKYHFVNDRSTTVPLISLVSTISPSCRYCWKRRNGFFLSSSITAAPHQLATTNGICVFTHYCHYLLCFLMDPCLVTKKETTTETKGKRNLLQARMHTSPARRGFRQLYTFRPPSPSCYPGERKSWTPLGQRNSSPSYSLFHQWLEPRG